MVLWLGSLSTSGLKVFQFSNLRASAQIGSSSFPSTTGGAEARATVTTGSPPAAREEGPTRARTIRAAMENAARTRDLRGLLGLEFISSLSTSRHSIRISREKGSPSP